MTQPRKIASRSACFLAASLFLLAGCDSRQLNSLTGAGAPLGDGAAPAASPGFASQEAQQVARDIEEADIVKIVDGKLYALNRYKGLIIVDVQDPDAPVLLGSVDLRGRGIEMYVSGQRVYVVLSADFYFAYSGGGGIATPAIAPGPMPPQPEFTGSQLAIINVANPAVPSLAGKINLVGYATDSRRVGDIIYVVGGNLVPFMPHQGDEPVSRVEEGFAASINVADPNNILPVERETFSGNGLEIHVSQTTIFAAGRDYDPNTGNSLTHVQTIDISDPAGAIVLRGSVDVPGSLRNRFYMDDYQDVLRIATDSNGFGFREAKLFTYDLSDLDHITLRGQTRIIQGESLEAVRFDGPRGYAVTFLRVDPLFVMDLSDPANPRVTGELEVPGYSTHIEPRGNRLIAVGVDDTNGNRPAVAYYDVEDPANPSQLSRVILGPPGSYTESEALWDEKAFKVIDELGLIVVPFKHVDYPSFPPGPIPTPFGTGASSSDVDRPHCTNGVQLVDFSDTALTQRGVFEHAGRVERVGVIGPRVFALSQVGLQTVDITDRSNPVQKGMIGFFSDDQMPFYADDCYGVIIDPGFGVPPDAIFAFLDYLMQNGMCGAVSALPLAAIPAGMWLMRTRRSRRRLD